MPKEQFCAITHVRKETSFLDMWLDYYGNICGRENLYVVIDGDDWEPESDLTGVNVELVTDAPRRRLRNDRWAAAYVSNLSNRLRRYHYNYVLRSDVDEFLCVDPNSGKTWDQAITEVDEEGYTYAVGLDVLHNPDLEGPLVKGVKILEQRRFAILDNTYTKPSLICRHCFWSGGFHRLNNRKVRISENFFLFHLALADVDLIKSRNLARDGDKLHPSYAGHFSERLEILDVAAKTTPMDFDVAMMLARRDFPFEEDGEDAKRPRPVRSEKANISTPRGKKMYVEIPSRFRDVI